MIISILLFTIGLVGFILNRKSLIHMLIAIELMLLSISVLLLISSYGFDDILGQIYGLFIISIAGAESAIGLGILVAYYRIRGTVSIETIELQLNLLIKIMYLTIIFLPRFASLIVLCFGRLLGITGTQILITSSIGVSRLLTILRYFEVIYSNSPVSIVLSS